jgi:RNA polymerase sigma-70 factor (ECF subfamily)
MNNETELESAMTGQPIEDEWVQRLTAPDSQPEALEELRAILMRGLRKAFRGAAGGEAFCEDVTQETLLRILERMDQFEGRSRFTSWALSIAVRIGTSQLRRKMFKDVSLNAADSEDNMRFQFADESAESPEIAQDKGALVNILKSLIAETLTDKQRQATDAILHGMPVEEIATRSGSNRNAVYKLIHDARMRLKEGLEKAGYSADDVLTLIG